jgi:hypothetical protein
MINKRSTEALEGKTVFYSYFKKINLIIGMFFKIIKSPLKGVNKKRSSSALECSCFKSSSKIMLSLTSSI